MGRDVGGYVVVAMGEDTEDDVGTVTCIYICRDLAFFCGILNVQVSWICGGTWRVKRRMNWWMSWPGTCRTSAGRS